MSAHCMPGFHLSSRYRRHPRRWQLHEVVTDVQLSTSTRVWSQLESSSVDFRLLVWTGFSYQIPSLSWCSATGRWHRSHPSKGSAAGGRGIVRHFNLGFVVKSDLRNHCAIVQPRLYYDSAMATQITLKTVDTQAAIIKCAQEYQHRYAVTSRV